MFRLIPDCHLAALPNSDHVAVIKNHDVLLSMLTAFFDETQTAAKASM